MKEKIKDRLSVGDKFDIVRLGESSKENLRSAYELALELEGLPLDTVEPPAKMFDRAGMFIWSWLDALDEILDVFCQENDLTGGVLGPPIVEDLKNIEQDKALRLFHLAHAVTVAETFKRDLIHEMMVWSLRQREIEESSKS